MAPSTRRISSGLAFELATREAFRIGFERAAPILLEPLMRIVVTTPEDYLGSIMRDDMVPPKA